VLVVRCEESLVTYEVLGGVELPLREGVFETEPLNHIQPSSLVEETPLHLVQVRYRALSERW
jgi:hypothetical protein